MSNSANAVFSVTTSKTIQGSAPRFITEIESDLEAGTQNFKYFGLHYNGNDYYNDSELQAAIIAGGYNPRVTKLSDLFNYSDGTGSLSFVLGTLAAEDVVDKDGDDINPILLSVLNPRQVRRGWFYINESNKDEADNPSLQYTVCESAIKDGFDYNFIILSEIYLKSRYGDPSEQPYPDRAVGKIVIPQHRFRIFPRIICSGMPWGSLSGFNRYEVFVDESDQTYGYIPQPTGKDNFPTTGANGFFFDLIVSGENVRTLSWPSITHGNITATVTILSKPNIKNKLQQTQIRVTLTGPDVLKDASGNAIGSTAPAFNGPATITIKGNDNEGNTVFSYPFTIKKWYISRKEKGQGYDLETQQNWCRNLSGTHYDIPWVFELSNVKAGYSTDFPSGLRPENFPFTDRGTPTRRIGGGLMSEWNTSSAFSGNLVLDGVYFTLEKGTSSMIKIPSPIVITKIGSSNLVAANSLGNVICVSRP